MDGEGGSLGRKQTHHRGSHVHAKSSFLFNYLSLSESNLTEVDKGNKLHISSRVNVNTGSIKAEHSWLASPSQSCRFESAPDHCDRSQPGLITALIGLSGIMVFCPIRSKANEFAGVKKPGWIIHIPLKNIYPNAASFPSYLPTTMMREEKDD